MLFRNHGMTKSNFKNRPHGSWYYEMQELGFNYRITDIQAALGASQLKKLNRFVGKRRSIVKAYNGVFKNNNFFDVPVEKDYAFSSYHLYPIRLNDKYSLKRREIFENLRKKGIGVQIHYIPVYLQPYYAKLKYRKGLCPNAERFYKSEISIPMFPSLKPKEIKYVINSVMKVLKNETK